jgi:Caspase domain
MLVLCSSVAHAEKRVALVIGNGAYANVPKLNNPTNDAAVMETMFRAARQRFGRGGIPTIEVGLSLRGDTKRAGNGCKIVPKGVTPFAMLVATVQAARFSVLESLAGTALGRDW